MKLFKRKAPVEADPLEQRLDTISDLTKDLDKKSFSYLIDAVVKIFETRQSLKKVKTEDEKEYGDIDDAERKLEEDK